MKIFTSLIVLGSIVATGSPALSQSMAGMPGMTKPASSVKTGSGSGVITGLDPRTAKVTIKHGAIPAVGWPAMTMTFAANPPSLVRGLRVGQKVGFDVRTRGMNAELTAVRVQ